MTGSPSVAFVTRRFWPLAGDSVWRTLYLADALRQLGWKIHILTAAWHSLWPVHVELRDLQVHRLHPSPTTPFRSRRYTRAVSEWIGKHADELDAVCIDASEEDAMAVATRSSSRLPVWLRCDSVDVPGAQFGPSSLRLTERTMSAARLVDRIIAPHDVSRRELIANGIPVDRIALIPDGPIIKLNRDAQSRAAARRAMSDINHELFLRSDDRLCLVVSDLTKSSGVEFVLRTIAPLCDNRRDIRCWIVGDGPERMRLYDLLKHEGWRHQFVMPGTFEDPELLLTAADLCVIPTAAQGASWLLPSALTNGIAAFGVDSPAMRARLPRHETEVLFEVGNQQMLGDMFGRWCKRPELYRDLAKDIAHGFEHPLQIESHWRSLPR